MGDGSQPAGPWRPSHSLAVVTSFITCACVALHVSHLPCGPRSVAWPLSLPKVPRGRALDGLLLPEGLQPLRPGGHHPLSFFFRCHFRTKTDLRGKDFKSAEVQRAVLQCKEGSTVRSCPPLSHRGNVHSWPPGSSENLPPPGSRECGRCPAASGPGRSWGGSECWAAPTQLSNLCC